MIPSVGRIVHYKLTALNAEHINRRREDAKETRVSSNKSGVQVHVGNTARAGDICAMLIVGLWTDNPDHQSPVQGQVFLDGNDNLWVSSVIQGDAEGQFSQPVRV
jgi:hypothetical protein